MSEPTIEQMNKTIAVFDGYKISKSGKTYRKDNESSPYRVRDIKYHSSWDWLMPVWKKAGKILFDIRGDLTEDKYLCVHRITKAFIYACQTVDIESAHTSVYNAILNIQWYNKQKEANNE
jgi:hypothetical protein